MASDNPIDSQLRSSDTVEIRRTTSAPPGHLGQSPSATRQGSASPVSRRQSAQERINDILETARQRADSIHGRSPVRFSDMLSERMPSTSEDPGSPESPNERTSMVVPRQTMNYQSTQTTSSLRNRQPPSRPETNHDSQNGGTTHETGEKHGLWNYLDGIWSIELENKGSVARDHLALERTFLAWLRTSLAFASIGIAITQLFRLNSSLLDRQSATHFRRLGKPLGTTFIGISILVLFLGYQRYYQPQQWLLKGKFPASRGAIILISFLAFAVMVASLIVILIIQPANVSLIVD